HRLPVGRAFVDLAVGEEHGRVDFCGQVNGRTGAPLRLVVAEDATDVAAAVGRRGGVAVGGEGFQVVQARQAGGALEHSGRADGDHHRRVRAEAGAVAADALRIRVTLRDRPAHAIDEVVLHARAPLAVAGALEGVAAAFAAAEIHLQHEVAAAGEELGV